MLETEQSTPLAPLMLRWQRLVQRLTANPLLTGSTFFFISTTLVNGGNYLFNLILGRWLGPALFADVSIIITLFLFFTFITAGFQQTAAKFAATYSASLSPTDPQYTVPPHSRQAKLFALWRWLNRRSWVIGLLCALLVGGAATFWQTFFHTTSAWIFVIFAIGLPFYFVQGIDRGLLQGQMHFGRLALTYQVEMWVRLLVGLLLVMVGWAAHGAVLGLTLSIVATWIVARTVGNSLRHDPTIRGTFSSPDQHATLAPAEQRALLAFALPVLIVETSLILINNSDVLIVKRFFDSVSAGHYAALALVGRIVFFGTWSVVLTLFPLVAQKEQRREAHRHLLWTALGMVFTVSAIIVAGTALVPNLIIQILFGAAYLPIAPLLWLYALATALFALSNVVINYHLALGHRTGAVLALAAGACQVVMLIVFHATLYQVVLIQIYLMALLLLLLLGWDWLSQHEK